MVSPEGLLNADGTLDLSTGFQGTLDLRGWEVTLDGERGPVLEPASVSAASGPAWGVLPNDGLNGTVYAVAVMGDDLYVGGAFTQTVDGTVINLGNIARYDTASETWHALPKKGLNNTVRALAAVGGDLYVGGQFTASGDGTVSDLGRIARYDTAGGAWHTLPRQGLSSWVTALAVVGDDLYVGGLFTQSGDVTPLDLKRIARYDTTGGTWHALPNDGLNNYANALAVVGDDLYVGGAFTASGDTALTGLNRIARYDTAGGAWGALPNDGLNGTVYALTAMGDDLYVGGNFAQTVDATVTGLGNVARYDTAGGTWHALPNEGLDGVVRALAVVGDDLYVGGVFTETGVVGLTNLNHIVRYDTAALTWNPLLNQGLDSTVFALAVVGDDLYAGGDFTQSGDGTVVDLGSVARYDIAVLTWRALNNEGLNGAVLALAAVGDDLYVGGAFGEIGDGSVTGLGNIARYDTTTATWSRLPNLGLNGNVRVLAVVGDDLYVGGSFAQTGDGTLTNLGNIVRYDITGETWHKLSNDGLRDGVTALAVVGDDLYVGGYFDETRDGTVLDLGFIARYDTAGSGTWHALNNEGLNGTVLALAAVGSDLYVGGYFTATGDGTVLDLNRIARYDITGGAWHALPKQGLDNAVRALAVAGSDMYVGGEFDRTSDWMVTDLGRIARYDVADSTWHALPNQGLNNTVYVLEVMGDDLYVGGTFTQTGVVGLTNLGHIARYDTADGTWHALPNQGLNGDAWALAAMGDDLYVGGDFTSTGDGTVTGLGGIARYSLYRHRVYLPLVIRQ
jgi:N-acetylneuraminic acid mutarotase